MLLLIYFFGVLSLSNSFHVPFALKSSKYAPKAPRMSNIVYEEKKPGVHTVKFEVAGKAISFETGKIGRQANGAVVAKTGDSMVYSTVCCEREAQPIDFTPLRVDWFARYSSVGQTVGAFHRRDSRGDDTEILVARLIDRPLRPMIAEGWQFETQVLTHVLSYDRVHPLEALSICAASAAMAISHVPMINPIAGVEVGLVDGELKVNPTKEEMTNSTLSLTMAGTKDGILMIEGAADFLPEELMVQALSIGHNAIGEICEAITELQKKAGKPKKTDALASLPIELMDAIDQVAGKDLEKALSIGDKHKRGAAVGKVEEKVLVDFVGSTASALLKSGIITTTTTEDNTSDSSSETELVAIQESEDSDTTTTTMDEENEDPNAEDEASELNSLSLSSKTVSSDEEYTAMDIKKATKKLLVRRLREMVLRTGKRSDGRSSTEVRPISGEHNLLPRAHGSALFTRGETQALATATLGSKAMEQRFETLDEYGTRKFYLQYRFPPSSVGEVGRVGGINRREVGHGNLAERALIPAIPSQDDFPYAIRAESLITESCGSSSMATVCGCCLAMLDAGVPLKSHVAGVAMGLILGETATDEPVILTDILGLEDALGTMDFKVAGDDKGITTFQLDIKSEGLTLEILRKALDQAKVGRLEILEKMREILEGPSALKDTIPRIWEFKIEPEAIGKIIGPKGKTIQSLIETHGVTNINLQDDGSVQVESFSDEANTNAKEAILKLAEEAKENDKRKGARGDGKGGKGGREKVTPEGPPPEPGIIYKECPIRGVQNFGVFVEVLPGYEGLVHISELDTKRIKSPEEAGYKEGDLLDVKCLGRNDKGQLRLSRRAVLLRNQEDEKKDKIPSTSAAAAEDVYGS